MNNAERVTIQFAGITISNGMLKVTRENVETFFREQYPKGTNFFFENKDVNVELVFGRAVVEFVNCKVTLEVPEKGITICEIIN